MSTALDTLLGALEIYPTAARLVIANAPRHQDVPAAQRWVAAVEFDAHPPVVRTAHTAQGALQALALHMTTLSPTARTVDAAPITCPECGAPDGLSPRSSGGIHYGWCSR